MLRKLYCVNQCERNDLQRQRASGNTDPALARARAAAKASGKVWTERKREACKRNADKSRKIQKEKKLQIYGDWEYFRRKGRLTRYGVSIDGKRIPADSLSETFKEYHLHYGVQRGGYKNPK